MMPSPGKAVGDGCPHNLLARIYLSIYIYIDIDIDSMTLFVTATDEQMPQKSHC